MVGAVFLLEGSSGTCRFSKGKTLIGRAVFRRTGKWQILFFFFCMRVQMGHALFSKGKSDRACCFSTDRKVANAVFRQEN